MSTTLHSRFEVAAAARGEDADTESVRAWLAGRPRAPRRRSRRRSRDGEAATPQLGIAALFEGALMPARGLAETDYRRAASALGAEIAAIQAVAEVETSGAAFDDRGRPRILFERHYFHRLTAGRYDGSHCTISAPTAGGYGKFAEQYGKLQQAFGLDAEAALRSASWGRFQIMGDNHVAAGFDSVQKFVAALMVTEAAHLDAFVAFVGADRAMADALRRKDWPTFARRYNGPAYASNSYDSKLRDACARCAGGA